MASNYNLSYDYFIAIFGHDYDLTWTSVDERGSSVYYKNSVSNLSDITSQGNISKSINGTFNTSLSNKAMMSNGS